MTRKYEKTPAIELEAKLRDLFAENRDIFEELIIRGWTVDLSLPSDGAILNFGYAPTGLSVNAGFSVSRSMSPRFAERIINNVNAAREVVR